MKYNIAFLSSRSSAYYANKCGRKLMGKGLLVFSSLLLFASSANAQTVTPEPTPPDDGKVVKVSTSLIQIDVTVTDERGRIVRDIKPEEVEIYENGQKQRVTHFSFVSNARRPPVKKDKKQDKDAVPEPPLVLRPDQVRRTIALVVDDLTLSFASAAYTRRALKKFVDEQMQDGDLVGVIRTGGGIGALQQFTSNKQQLYAAIERVKWNSAGRGRFGSFDPVEPTMAQNRRSSGDEFVSNEEIQAERDFNDSNSDFKESLFTTGTLGALKYIVANMGELPGRKSVILFSDGFQIFPGMKPSVAPARLMNDGPSGMMPQVGSDGWIAAKTLDFLKELISIANRESVVFYTIDARGLEVTGPTAADNFADPTSLDPTALGAMNSIHSERSGELFSTQQGLVYLAKETGGFAYVNQNDLNYGVEKALDDQSYYLVAYQPDEESFDAEKRKFNRLEVKISRGNTKVRHRTGFFVEDAAKEEEKIRIDFNTPTKIMRALTSPFAVNGINLRLNALFGHNEKRGYYMHSFLHINAKDLTFTKLQNGNYQAVFDVLAVSYGENGVPVDKNSVVGTINFPPDRYQQIQNEGFSYSFIFPVKKPGAYQMRVAIFDRGNKEVGSANQFVEVPNLKKTGVTLSGIVLENLSMQAWNQLMSGSSQVLASSTSKPDPLQDTSLRRFRRGTVLRYGVEIYNGKLPSNQQAQIRIQTRVFHDRKKVFEGEERQLDVTSQPGNKEPVFTDAVSLGENLLPGDYVLQVVVTDGLARQKKRLATQYVQFEVLE